MTWKWHAAGRANIDTSLLQSVVVDVLEIRKYGNTAMLCVDRLEGGCWRQCVGLLIAFQHHMAGHGPAVAAPGQRISVATPCLDPPPSSALLPTPSQTPALDSALPTVALGSSAALRSHPARHHNGMPGE